MSAAADTACPLVSHGIFRALLFLTLLAGLRRGFFYDAVLFRVTNVSLGVLEGTLDVNAFAFLSSFSGLGLGDDSGTRSFLKLRGNRREWLASRWIEAEEKLFVYF